MILAKSNPPISLEEHVDDCLKIADALEEALPALQQLTTPYFWQALRYAIILHDLGKAHVEFQNYLQKKPNTWKSRRHEIYSTKIAASLPDDLPVKRQILWAVLGHHKTFHDLQKALKAIDRFNKEAFEMGMEPQKDYHDLTALQMESVVKLLQHYGLEVPKISDVSVLRLLKEYSRELPEVFSQAYLLNLMLVGALKQCDHLGSAKVTSVPKLRDDNFKFLDNLKQKLEQKGKSFHDHQSKAASAVGNVLLTAPTGAGKTEASMLWLRNQLKVSGQGRVFYVLPYTASINAMFERLQEDVEEDDKVGLSHGKLQSYLYNYFDEQQYSDEQKLDKIKEFREQFRALNRPLKVTTPFQLLKHFFGVKGFDKGFAEMAGGYFIFDEIHAYDPTTTAQLLTLIEFVVRYLKGKVMVMTATLPRFLRKELQEVMGEHLKINATKELYSQFQRHRLELLKGDIFSNLSQIKDDLQAGVKVLVVCNTVKQSQQVYRELADYASSRVLLHGAFVGRDRFRYEKLLQDQEPQLLVGTQAIEVSLNIDYDVIYTEPAPLDALLQRFGRVNRNREKGICPCYVFTEGSDADSYIYSAGIIERTLKVLGEVQEVNQGRIVEEKLQEHIDVVYPNWEEEDRNEFDDVMKLFRIRLESLQPFQHSKESEDDFYSKFDGIPIVPVAELKEYKDLLGKRKFIEAERLTTSVTKGKFRYWVSPESDNIRPEEVYVDGKKGFTAAFYVTNKKYNPELGLLRDEEESWAMAQGESTTL